MEVKKIIRQGYDSIFEEFVRKYGRIDKKEKVYLDRFLQLIEGNKILDIGCGTGKHSEYFKSKDYDVYSLDISRKMVLYTKEKNILKNIISKTHSFEFIQDYLWYLRRKIVELESNFSVKEAKTIFGLTFLITKRFINLKKTIWANGLS